jgi:hypothetical protein
MASRERKRPELKRVLAFNPCSCTLGAAFLSGSDSGSLTLVMVVFWCFTPVANAPGSPVY